MQRKYLRSVFAKGVQPIDTHFRQKMKTFENKELNSKESTGQALVNING